MSTVNGFSCGLLVITCLSSAASGRPLATPVPAVPVQVSSATDAGIFQIMRGDLVFYPPDPFLYVLKQLWRESSKSSTTGVSLQIYNPDSATAAATSVNPRLFLTRDGASQPESYSPIEAFGQFADDSRLLRQKCCGCGNGSAPVTFYWPQDTLSSSTVGILTASTGQTTNSLKLSQGTTTGAVLCALSNLKIQEFPYVEPRTGAPHPQESATSRVRRSAEKIPVQMIVDFDTNQYVVGVRRLSAVNYVLTVLPYTQRSCKTATAFYYEGYEEYNVGLDGRITSRPSFTLQHVATRLYVVADVLDTLALNVGSNFTGLKLQNDTDFDKDTPEFPDYRFFVRYDDLDVNFLGDYSESESSSTLGSSIHILCPLYHRRFCLEPATSGVVKVAPVTLSDQRPWPTLMDPFSGFSEFLRRLNSSGIIPTFYFKPIRNSAR